jgi:hypothetical protein
MPHPPGRQTRSSIQRLDGNSAEANATNSFPARDNRLYSPPMLPSPGGVIAVVVVIIAAIISGRSSLLSNPGPEAGMVLAVVGGVAIALAGAVLGARRQRGGFVADWRAGLMVGALSFAVFWLATAIGAAVSPSCSQSVGRLPMAIMALPVLALQAAVGPLIGRLIGRARRAFFVCLLLELVVAGSIAVSLWNEPGFRVASHFFVVISTDLLAGASLPEAAIGFRLATMMLAITIALVGSAMWPAEKTRGLVSGAASDSARVWALALVVGIAFVVAHNQARAALIPGRDAMDEAYSLHKRRGNLVVHADPLRTTPREVDGVLAEGVLWQGRLAARLGPISSEDIHIWVHPDRAQMARYTGAVHVDFAMPWRRELHISGTTIPHRSLGHELAHVVVGERSDTFLHVPSRFIVMHNAAVTEGVAMALTPELVVNEGLTLREQAAAMRRTKQAPDLHRLFSFMSFFGEEPGRAYVAAGAVIESIVAESADDGPGAIERLYRGAGDLTAVTDDEADLIARHEAALEALPLPSDAVAYAAVRFKRPSILDEVCDPEVAEAAVDIRRKARLGDLAGAKEAARALQGDDADGTLSELVADVREVGDSAGTIELLRDLVAMSPSASARATRQLALGIELWRAGREREAQGVWAAVDVDIAVVDLQRQIVATRMFAESAIRLRERAPMSRAALAFFIADPRLRDGARLALAESVGRGSVDESAQVVALAQYVHARQLVQQGSLEPAIALLRPLVAGQQLLPPMLQEQAVLALATALVRRPPVPAGDAPVATGDAPVATGDAPVVAGDAPVVAGDAPVTAGDAPVTAGDAPVAAGDAPVVAGEAPTAAPAEGPVGPAIAPVVPSAAADEAQRLLLSAADGATRPAMRLFFRDKAERASRAMQAPAAPTVATATSDPAWADRLLLGTSADGTF